MADLTVQHIAQDRQGFLWFAGQSGLSRYDGYRFSIYRNDFGNPSSLSDIVIQTLHIDDQGRLWVGTRSGIQRYDPVADNFVSYLTESRPAARADFLDVRAIAHDAHGNIWLGTRSGLRRLDPISGNALILSHDTNSPDSLASDDVTDLTFDDRGNLWVGTISGVDRLAPNSTVFKHFKVNDEPTTLQDANRTAVQSLLFDHQHTLWIGTRSGLKSWQIEQGSPTKMRTMGTAEGITPTVVSSIYQDQADRIWVGTESDGLKLWDANTGKFTGYQHYPGLPRSLGDNHVASLFQDRTGMLWVGSWTAGLSQADLNTPSFITDIPGGALSGNNKILAIIDDGPEHLWLGSNGSGLIHFSPKTGEVHNFRHRPNDARTLNDDHVVAIGRDALGRLWVGTKTGLNLFNPTTGQFKQYFFETGDPLSNMIQSIYSDKHGMLWISSRGGLHRIDPVSMKIKTFRPNKADPGSIAENYVWCVLEDSKDRFWVGTSYGLDLMNRDTERFMHHRSNPNDPGSLRHNRISYLHEDSAGRLWVGTGGGLHVATIDDPATIHFRPYLIKDGFVNDTIDSIVEDSTGQFWLGTDGGLSCLDPNTGEIRNYFAADGVIETGYWINSAFRARDGVLYFGSFADGITSFRPSAIHKNPRLPELAITDFQIFNRSVRSAKLPQGVTIEGPLQAPKSITLSYNHSVFSFEFAALHFVDPKRNAYAYQLEGFDKDWVPTDARRRFATYTNLDPGHYIFRVKASNNDGIWNDQGIAFDVDITPPFWQTWWFRSLAIGLSVFAIYLAYQIRIRGLIHQRWVLAQEVEERTKEVIFQKDLVELEKTKIEHQKSNVESANQRLEKALSELRETQQQLVFQAKMISMGTLTAGVAHEINNPTNFAHAGAQSLEMDLERFRSFLMDLAGDEASGEVGQTINQRVDALVAQASNITVGTSRIRDLIKDLRSFSRIGEADRKTVSIQDSLLSTINLVRTHYADLVDIQCHFSSNPLIECWPAQLNQVFMNIIVNACQAIEQKNRESAHAAHGKLDIHGRQETDYFLIEFEDNGCGISADLLERIFDPFYTTRAEGEGTGLGLSISFGIIKKHQGDISVRSVDGEGCCFTVRLPLSLPTNPGAELY